MFVYVRRTFSFDHDVSGILEKFIPDVDDKFMKGFCRVRFPCFQQKPPRVHMLEMLHLL